MADKKTALGEVPRWDLSNVYPDLDSKEFKAAVQELEKQLDGIEAYQKARHR